MVAKIGRLMCWEYNAEIDPYYERGEVMEDDGTRLSRFSDSEAIKLLMRATKIGLTVMNRAGEITTSSIFAGDDFVEMHVGSSKAKFSLSNREEALFTEADLRDV